MIPWFESPHVTIIPEFHVANHAIGPITIYAFGVLVVIGILTGSALTHRRGRQLGLIDEKIASMISTVLICGFLFSHVFDVFAYQTKGPILERLMYGNDTMGVLWEIINPFGGMSSYGGFIGAVGGLFYWCKRNKQQVMPYADSLAFGLATGWFFGRCGCFTAHDHPGAFTSFFLAVRYPEGARHDLGLDEAIYAAVIAGIFLTMIRDRKRPLGIYLSILSLSYAPVRFALDFLRATDTKLADPRYLGLTPAQYGCIVVLVWGTLLLRWTLHQRPIEHLPA